MPRVADGVGAREPVRGHHVILVELTHRARVEPTFPRSCARGLIVPRRFAVARRSSAAPSRKHAVVGVAEGHGGRLEKFLDTHIRKWNTSDTASPLCRV